MKVLAGTVMAPPRMLDNIHGRAVKEIAAFWLASVTEHVETLESQMAADSYSPTDGAPDLKPPKLGPTVMKAIRERAEDLFGEEIETVEAFFDQNDLKDEGWTFVGFHDDVLPTMTRLTTLEGLDLSKLFLARALLRDAYYKYDKPALHSADRKLQDYLIPFAMKRNRKPRPTDDAHTEMRERSRKAKQETLDKYRKAKEFFANIVQKPKTTTRRTWEEPVDMTGMPSSYPMDAVTDGTYSKIGVRLLITQRRKPFAGRYHTTDKRIELVSPYGGDIPSEEGFKRLKEDIRTIVEHELQHMVQFIMQDSLRLRKAKEGREAEGPTYLVPREHGRKAGTPYGPKDDMPRAEDNAADKVAYPSANKQDRYYLDPIEFFPQVNTYADGFVLDWGSSPKDKLLDRWKAFVGLKVDNKIGIGRFFGALKRHDKRLWRRAVGEGWVIVKKKTGWADSPTGSPYKDAVREKLKQHVDKKRGAVPASATLPQRGPLMHTSALRRNRSRRFDLLTAQLARTPLRASTRLALEEAASMLALFAMSMEKAKEVLGFPPSASPTTDEIKKAYRAKAMENHPDRGGDPEKMKEVNVAVEILEGTRRPDKTFEPAPAPSHTPSPSPSYSPPRSTYKPPVRKKVSLEDALADHRAVLNDVTWLFRTTSQKSGSNYMGDESSSSDLSYCAYGKKPDGTLIFLGLRSDSKSDYDGSGHDIWTTKVLKVPDNSKATDPSFLTRKVIEALKAVGFNGKFNHKVYDANEVTGIGVEPLKKVFNLWNSRSKAVNVKHWLVNSGQVAADDPKVASRKHVVDLVYRVEGYMSRDEKPTLVLVVNGQEKPLSAEDSAKAIKAGVLRLVFGTYYYPDSRKNLNKAKFGKKVMKALAQAPSLDEATKAILEKLGEDPAAAKAA